MSFGPIGEGEKGPIALVREKEKKRLPDRGREDVHP